MLIILLVHAFVTWFLVGIIWLVQIVHYPLFARVGRTEFVAYERAHMGLIACVVIGPMLVELATAVLLLIWRPAAVPAWSAYIGLGLVVVIWVSTFGVQMPQHAALANGFDAGAHRRLVGANWIRTIAWSARGVLVAWLLWRVLSF